MPPPLQRRLYPLRGSPCKLLRLLPSIAGLHAGRLVMAGARPLDWPQEMLACVGLALHIMESPPLVRPGRAAPLVDAAAPSCSAAGGAGDEGCQLAVHQLEVSWAQASPCPYRLARRTLCEGSLALPRRRILLRKCLRGSQASMRA